MIPPFLLGAIAIGILYSSANKRKHAKREREGEGDLLSIGKSAIKVGVGCSTWTVVDHDKLVLLLRKVYADARLAGNSDPYDITERIFRVGIPSCRGKISTARNQEEIFLQQEVFLGVVDMLSEDGVYSEEDTANVYETFLLASQHRGEALA